MIKPVVSFLAASCLIYATPANACRTLITSVKLSISDVVVDGTAHCLEVEGQCRLSISDVVKGGEHVDNFEIEIRVNEVPVIQQRDDDLIIVGGCPQAFEPLQAETSGRFHLSKRDDGTFFAAHRIDSIQEKMQMRAI